MCTRPELAFMADRQYSRWRVTAQPAWKEPVAGIVAAWVSSIVKWLVQQALLLGSVACAAMRGLEHQGR
jgi:hypothetical protein